MAHHALRDSNIVLRLSLSVFHDDSRKRCAYERVDDFMGRRLKYINSLVVEVRTTWVNQ